MRLSFVEPAAKRGDIVGAKYRPDQPRVAAGNPDGGQWTDAGGGDGLTGGAGRSVSIGGGGYPIDLLKEEESGGHTFERHIAKPPQYLKARILENRTTIPGIFSFGAKRAGSFPSLEAATKLVNSTLSSAENALKVEAFSRGDWKHSLPFLYVFKTFKTPTGYEAYSPQRGYQPVIRDTYGVTVRLQRSDKNPRGYFVHSAWPMNED